jgi:hypothetical protein
VVVQTVQTCGLDICFINIIDIKCMKVKVGKTELMRIIEAMPENKPFEECIPDSGVTLEGEVEEKLTIVPSGRIDWCGDRKAEHGYDCPKDVPKNEWCEC